MNSRNAHEKSDISAPELIDHHLADVIEQIRQAGDRMPVERHGTRPGLIDPRIRRAVFMRDQFQCAWCRRPVEESTLFELDHITPWSAGGTNATDNLRVLCQSCNQERSNYRTDADGARALLIVGDCHRCKGRHNVTWFDSEDGLAHYVYDDADLEPGADDLEVPAWCLTCRRPSSVSEVRAALVRAKQVDLWAPYPDGTPAT